VLYHLRSVQPPLLMAHGDQDRAIPFSQAVEMFNSLRRFGNAAVVLLEYQGEDHVLEPRAQQDLDGRMLGFFDHFLKGAPAPDWWSAGLSFNEGRASGDVTQASER